MVFYSLALIPALTWYSLIGRSVSLFHTWAAFSQQKHHCGCYIMEEREQIARLLTAPLPSFQLQIISIDNLCKTPLSSIWSGHSILAGTSPNRWPSRLEMRGKTKGGGEAQTLRQDREKRGKEIYQKDNEDQRRGSGDCYSTFQGSV